MSAVSIEQFGLEDRRRVREFVGFPWRLHRQDPCWTPPLSAELLGNRLLRMKGLLTREHPYHRHAEVTHFLVRRDGRVVGRVSGSVDRAFNDFHGCRIAFFGFFDVIDDADVADALLDAVREWASGQGMEALRGPGQYGCATHERQGVLVHGFGHPPTIDLTHNPPYYARLIENAGFEKVMDYHAFWLTHETLSSQRIQRLADRVRARGGVEVRCGDPSRLDEEVRLILRIYNEVWSKNWGFMPISEDEAESLASTLGMIVDPGLFRFAYVRGELAGVLGVIPDPYWALRPRWRWYGDSDTVRLARLALTRRRIPRLRAVFFGVREPYRRMGVDAVLFDEALRYGLGRGIYTGLEGSMTLETNDLIQAAVRALGAERYKTWRIYERAL